MVKYKFLRLISAVMISMTLVLNFGGVNAYAEEQAKPASIEEKIYGKISSWFGQDKAEKVKTTVEKVKKSFASLWTNESKESAAPANNESVVKAEPTAPAQSEAEGTSESPENFKEVEARLAELESYKQANPSEFSGQVTKAKGDLAQHALFEKTKEGRAGQPNLKVTIPVGKPIPKLDVGLEPEIQKKDLIPLLLEIKKGAYASSKSLRSPNEIISDKAWSKYKSQQIVVVKGPTEVDPSKWKMQKPVTREEISRRVPTIQSDDPNYTVQPYVDFTSEDLAYLTAKIEFERGRCHNVIGVVQPLLSIAKYSEDAKFWLGVCAAKNGLQSDQVAYLLPFVKGEHPLYFKEALENLVTNLRPEYFSMIADDLKKVGTAGLNQNLSSKVNYVIAKDADRADQYSRVITHAEQVREGSEYYADAQFLLAVALFTKDRTIEAEKALKTLRAKLEKSKTPDQNVLSLIALTLGRVAFDRKNYDVAVQEYRKVDKNHGAWIQAMTELGWAQIMSGDYAGAIGNMYSLHSPFFETVFKPESYAVRAIGYLNICQYGDAYKAITRLENQHRGWVDKISVYLQNRKNPQDYYQTVSKYLTQGNSKVEVDGLPPQVVREMARRRNFINTQTMINDKIDEKELYNKVNGLISKEIAQAKWAMNKAGFRIIELKKNLNLAKTNRQLAANVNEWNAQLRNEERLVVGYKFQIVTYERAKKDLVNHVRVAVKRMGTEEARLRQIAGVALKTNLTEMNSQMRQLLENNEFLRFEAFAGSGENIRYQVGGGETKTPTRIPADVKPKKILNWDFDGEYWEDEIGSYRSSLRNNCPKYTGQASLGGQ